MSQKEVAIELLKHNDHETYIDVESEAKDSTYTTVSVYVWCKDCKDSVLVSKVKRNLYTGAYC